MKIVPLKNMVLEGGGVLQEIFFWRGEGLIFNSRLEIFPKKMAKKK